MKIRFVEDLSSDDAVPGDARWLSEGGEGVFITATGEPVPLRQNAAIAYRCPGCNDLRGVRVSTVPHVPGTHCWQWDGDLAVPTLKPSLQHMDCACKWHGFLTAGEFRSA